MFAGITIAAASMIVAIMSVMKKNAKNADTDVTWFITDKRLCD